MLLAISPEISTHRVLCYGLLWLGFTYTLHYYFTLNGLSAIEVILQIMGKWPAWICGAHFAGHAICSRRENH